METKTKSQTAAADVAALLRARNGLLWIVSREEARVESYLTEAAASAGYLARFWDVAQGLRDGAGKPVSRDTEDAGSALDYIASRSASGENATDNRAVWIMRDLSPWITGLSGAAPCRRLRNLARSLPSTPRASAQAVIVISPSGDVPSELGGAATVIEWPLPDRAEIAGILDASIEPLPDEIKSQAVNGTRDAAIDAAMGLSGDEAAANYAKSIVQLRRLDPAAIAQEKKRTITRERVLEWFDPLPGGIDAVGGLENLKAWLASRRLAYSAKARAYGLPAPKGMLLVGPPGTGKSLTAKAVATAWGIPLLRLDMGALKSKYVGDSEANIRKAFRVIEAIGRSVVWIDEIEKALAGATGGAADGGVSADALGAILSWMQDKAGESFIIATSNDVTALPPELTRKGRFDEVFYVDLPDPTERAAILAAALRSYGRDIAAIGDPARVAAIVGERCDQFSGAEIAALVPDALFRAFADNGRDLTAEDLEAAAATVAPLAKSAADKLDGLRRWAKEKGARRANADAQTAPQATKGRQLDI